MVLLMCFDSWGEESVGEFGKVLFVHKRNGVLPVLPLGYDSLLLPPEFLHVLSKCLPEALVEKRLTLEDEAVLR